MLSATLHVCLSKTLEMTNGNHRRVSTETSNTEILLDDMLHLLDRFIQTDLQHHERGRFSPDGPTGN